MTFRANERRILRKGKYKVLFQGFLRETTQKFPPVISFSDSNGENFFSLKCYYAGWELPEKRKNREQFVHPEPTDP